MARRRSNRDRIARMREEANATQREQEEKRKSRAAAGSPKRSRSTTSSEPARLKAVWAIKDGAGEIVATYPYAFKAAAEAEASRLKTADHRDYIVCPHKVPFDA
ncbi:MAG: hypothetical protein ACYTDU_06485 [Planctomycetota bacterium]|jgi:hypothetical protein